MPKPRTKGPTIQFRLPLPAHAKLERIAESLETTVHDVARALTELGVEEHEIIKGQLVRPSVKRDPDSEASDLDKAFIQTACTHTKTTVIAGGLKRCNDCGAVANTKGIWHLP